MYYTTYDVKVPFSMPELSGNKIINRCFHADNHEGESGIGYDMIIFRNLMVQLGLTADFTRQVLQRDGTTVHMKEYSNLLGKSDLTKHEIREVVMQTEEPASTWEANERMVKTLDSTYENADLKQAVNDSQMNSKERTLLLRLLEDFGDLFDGTLGD